MPWCTRVAECRQHHLSTETDSGSGLTQGFTATLLQLVRAPPSRGSKGRTARKAVRLRHGERQRPSSAHRPVTQRGRGRAAPAALHPPRHRPASRTGPRRAAHRRRPRLQGRGTRVRRGPAALPSTSTAEAAGPGGCGGAAPAPARPRR